MKMTSEICVLCARRYSMTDKETGELVRGVKVSYVEDWQGNVAQNQCGVEILSATMPYEMWDKFQRLPAIYSAEFAMYAGAKGKAMLRAVSMDYVQPFMPVPVPAAGKH